MRPIPVVLAIALAATPALLAGCTGEPESSLRLAPFVPFVHAEAGRATQFMVHVKNEGGFREEARLGADDLPANWSVSDDANGTLRVDGQSTAVVVFTVTPDANATFGTRFLRLAVGGARAIVAVEVADLGPVAARAGVGARVRTVGALLNGTVFYTNLKSVRDDPRFTNDMNESARADEEMEPFKAFLGGTRGATPPEPYASAGYRPTIAGFDARLRTGNGGMRANETLVVRVAPEDAYSREGDEGHRLFGQTLVFTITIVAVDELEAACVDERVPRPPTGCPTALSGDAAAAPVGRGPTGPLRSAAR